MTEYYKPTYPIFAKSFDEIKGFDSASIKLSEVTYVGVFLKSPLTDRLASMFGDVPFDDQFKPFKAIWVITNSKLLLTRVNSEFKGIKRYTNDLVPEFPRNKLFYYYKKFTGIIPFKVQSIEIPDGEVLADYDCEILSLNIYQGNLHACDKVNR